jgi:hypothetical protein
VGDESALTRIATLPPAERQVLAALAVVGRASLSGEELAELVEVKDVTPLIADLERQELIERDEKRRYSALGRIGEEIRKTDDALETGERLLQYMTTLAKDGRLTPGRLLDDAGAILGLTEWAADLQQWERLLELVKTLQACFGIASRVEEWRTLLERGRSAARALGDRLSEVWVLQQLAAASASAGDPSAERRFRREADELQRELQLAPGQGKRDEGGAGGPQGTTDGPGPVARIALWALALVVAAAAGGATGYAIGNGNGSPTTTRTVTINGRSVTTTTVTVPTTVLDTTTVTTTIVSPPPPPPSSSSSSSTTTASP